MTITQPHTPHTQLLSVNVWMCCVLCYLATANCYCYSISNRRQGQWNAIRIYRFRLAGRTVSHIDNFLVRKSLFTCTFPVFRALTYTHDESMAGVVPRLPCYLSIEMNICIFKFTSQNCGLPSSVYVAGTCVVRRSRTTIQAIIGHFVNCRTDNGRFPFCDRSRLANSITHVHTYVYIRSDKQSNETFMFS